MIGLMMQVGTLSLPGDDAGARSGVAPRGARVRATLFDVGALLAGGAVALLVGVLYLLVRTSWGTYDAGDFDSALATALLLAVPPTWMAWMLTSITERGATPGQRRAGLVVANREGGRRWARLLRMALHPLSVPFWLWSGAMFLLLGTPLLAILVLLWAGVVMIGGLISMVMFAIRPRTPAIHDLLARTRVVVRS